MKRLMMTLANQKHNTPILPEQEPKSWSPVVTSYLDSVLFGTRFVCVPLSAQEWQGCLGYQPIVRASDHQENHILEPIVSMLRKEGSVSPPA